MICKRLLIVLFSFFCLFGSAEIPTQKAQNPVIFADVPDMSMMRVGDTYYMSSTTMHMAPGVPIMTSKDLVNWEMASYCYDILDDVDALNLVNGKSTYGRGTWASSIRYHKGLFYVSTFAQTTNKTYFFTTDDPEKGEWKKTSFSPAYHDHSLFFDDDGRAYFIWGVGRLRIIELEADLSGVKKDTERVLIENASAPAGNQMGLQSEGSQLFKINGMYYLFNICWPRGGMRTVVIHRASSLDGPWEGRLALQDKGVAQGGLIDTPDGRWFAYLFRDYGSVGRIPYLVPVHWEEGWPVLGIEGKVPDELDLPASQGLKPGIVNDDEFNRKPGEPGLPLVWQWNHNPDNSLWSLSERPGYLRLKTGRIDQSFLLSRNTLTQRSFGPWSSGSTLLDVSNLKDGDVAGLVALQRKFGQVGVKMEDGRKYLFMTSNKTDTPTEIERLPLKKKKVNLRIDCDFREMTDVARFYYSLNGKTWKEIGRPLKMEYTLVEHFMGYRFGLFNYATKQSGGWADFDYFRINDQIIENND
ncbi:MAG: glycosyl hydrolase 43 family protein [Bacteroidales bacterium]|nr:glycosyl hydrolase 43 family protein [Bacteroidales bacterium]